MKKVRNVLLLLSYGAYYFVEVMAPDGYELNTDKIHVSLTKTLSYSADYPWTIRVEHTKIDDGTGGIPDLLTGRISTADTGSTEKVDVDADTGSEDAVETVTSSEENAPDSNDTARDDVSGTGDDSNLMFWFVVMVIAGAGLAAAAVAVKRRHRIR